MVLVLLLLLSFLVSGEDDKVVDVVDMKDVAPEKQETEQREQQHQVKQQWRHSLDVFYSSKRRVPNASDPLHNRSRPTLIISSPSAVEECFTKNDIVFANRHRSIADDYLTYNYTVVMWASYNDLWQSLRRLAFVELFSSKSLQKSSIVHEQEIRNILSHLMKIGN
ncbi:hypothetical protein TEA_000523 [Camellia sinensis var. sinensis]|uniref:Cytochrome P450 n=1 Tax=Camellia sinensis var. sinensis TaxID=542762 RepID=A0A4S4D215_CAMSN|nr:hypothetical protein TEA_000523 [Camellia sinensis var. sinensis]